MKQHIDIGVQLFWNSQCHKSKENNILITILKPLFIIKEPHCMEKNMTIGQFECHFQCIQKPE